MKRLVIVSNRVPVPKEGLRPGGLAVVLKDLLARKGGMWFGWNGTCHPDAAHLPPEIQQAEGVEYATIGLTPAEHRNYYTGFSNSTLWPLMHSLPEHIHFERRELATYWSVNERFCENLLPLLRAEDVIWIHDYHLLPLPALLRRHGVRQPIGFFLHTPFPAPDMLATAPDGGTFLRDLMKADLLGFQTADDTANFIFAATRKAGAIAEDDSTLTFEGRRVHVGTFPVEIDPQTFAQTAVTAAGSADLRRLSGSLAGRKLIFGVDRMDPTKSATLFFGRLVAVERNFASGVGNHIHFFVVDLSRAENILGKDRIDPASVAAVSKSAWFEIKEGDFGLDIDNIESLAFGPVVDGKQLFVIASDDNFNPGKQFTQFAAFAVPANLGQ